MNVNAYFQEVFLNNFFPKNMETIEVVISILICRETITFICKSYPLYVIYNPRMIRINGFRKIV